MSPIEVEITATGLPGAGTSGAAWAVCPTPVCV
jgi:hypothetical protein